MHKPIDILFFSDQMKGHIIPTFKIANNLKQKGFTLCYLGGQQVMKEVANMGFDTIVWEDLVDTPEIESNTVNLLLSGVLDELMKNLSPKLIIATAHSPMDILTCYYRYQIETILVWSHFPIKSNFEKLDLKINLNKDLLFSNKSFSPYLRTSKAFINDLVRELDPVMVSDFIDFLGTKGYQINSLEDFSNPFEDFHHFITCPKQMLMNDIPERAGEIYLGPSLLDHNIYADKNWDPYQELGIDRRKAGKLLFCSMGSWANRINASSALENFNFILKCMEEEEMQEYHLILAAGTLRDHFEQRGLPSNVSVHKWVPQFKLLQHLSLAIIHGGMGSIKECILCQVPMLIMPLGLDQFDNAKRVVHHQLGIEINDTKLMTPAKGVQKMISILSSERIEKGLTSMKKVFIAEETQQSDAQFVDEILNQYIIQTID